MGSPLSREQMLAIILYTDSGLHQDFRRDEIAFSMQDVTANSGVFFKAKIANTWTRLEYRASSLE